MNYMEKMKEEWAKNFDDLTSSSLGFKKFGDGSLTKEDYKAILRAIFHNVRINSQIMAMSTLHFKGKERDSIKCLLNHAVQETGHENLALNDLKALGEDVSGIEDQYPSAASMALTGAITYLVQFVDPVCLLGYMFHLEYTPTQVGAAYIDRLKTIGVSDDAVTFIDEHSKVDVGHVKLMERYVANMVTSDEKFEKVKYAMRVTCELYGKMIDDAIVSRASKI